MDLTEKSRSVLPYSFVLIQIRYYLEYSQAFDRFHRKNEIQLNYVNFGSADCIHVTLLRGLHSTHEDTTKKALFITSLRKEKLNNIGVPNYLRAYYTALNIQIYVIIKTSILSL